MSFLKNSLIIVLVLLITSTAKVRSQSTDTLNVHNDSLLLIRKVRLDTLKNGILLGKQWKYHPGDDFIWAKKEYNDSNWLPIQYPNFKIDDLNGESWTGIGWFRRKFKIDSELYNTAVAFEFTQKGASEIYLNGKRLKRFGKISTDSVKEKRFNPQGIPFVAVFDTSAIQVIAIRYSNLRAQHFAKYYPQFAERAGFTLRIKKNDFAIDSMIEENNSNIAFPAVISGGFVALTLIHLLLFFFYARGKENLYFSFFTGSIALLMVVMWYSNNTHSVSDFSFIVRYLAPSMLPLIFAGYVFFLYAIFYDKMPKQFLVILVLGTLLGLVPIIFNLISWFGNYIYGPFMVLLTVEGLRVVILAIKRKKRNSLIIGIGVILFFSFVILIAIASLTKLENYMPEWVGTLMALAGILSLPVSMSIYIARENARTKADLENRIIQVQELSEKAIEHEKREAKLRVENTRKEVELQKAAELKSAYENLEVAHEELKSTQKQLIQSEKMASLGELTAGIAHEIQNPLNFVNNFSDLNKELVDELKEELAIGTEASVQSANEIADDIKNNEEKINHHGKRAESIVKGMLQHSRGSSGQKEPTDINALCDEYLRLSYHGFRAKDKSFNADFKLEIDESLPKIEVVPQDIGRVLLNLINNAFFAVNERAKQNIDGYKSEVVVSTSSSPFGEGGTKGGLKGVTITVSDNGPGIPISIKEKIFQPFFTTKPTGSGTGLGLSLSYDIIKAHGGTITVSSEENVGTKFIIQIPISNHVNQ